MPRGIELTTSVLASSLRGWRGTMAHPAKRQPEQPVELYEFEGCPHCRLVREALTELELDAAIRPCPKGGERFRGVAERLGGKQQFPFLHDPNTNTRLYEAADIIGYLYATYAECAPPGRLAPHGVQVAASTLATAVRGLGGMRRRPSRTPDQPLELYSFESSPYSRPVRELLCELEIPYLLRSMGKAVKADLGPPWVRTRFFPDAPVRGRNRERMHARTGRLQVPYLIDPNTGRELYESAEIRRYLLDNYTAS